MESLLPSKWSTKTSSSAPQKSRSSKTKKGFCNNVKDILLSQNCTSHLRPTNSLFSECNSAVEGNSSISSKESEGWRNRMPSSISWKHFWPSSFCTPKELSIATWNQKTFSSTQTDMCDWLTSDCPKWWVVQSLTVSAEVQSTLPLKCCWSTFVAIQERTHLHCRFVLSWGSALWTRHWIASFLFSWSRWTIRKCAEQHSQFPITFEFVRRNQNFSHKDAAERTWETFSNCGGSFEWSMA